MLRRRHAAQLLAQGRRLQPGQFQPVLDLVHGHVDGHAQVFVRAGCEPLKLGPGTEAVDQLLAEEKEGVAGQAVAQAGVQRQEGDGVGVLLHHRPVAGAQHGDDELAEQAHVRGEHLAVERFGRRAGAGDGPLRRRQQCPDHRPDHLVPLAVHGRAQPLVQDELGPIGAPVEHGLVPAPPQLRVALHVLDEEHQPPGDGLARGGLPVEQLAGAAAVRDQLLVDVAEHPQPLEWLPAEQVTLDEAGEHQRVEQPARSEQGAQRPVVIELGGEAVQIKVAHRPVRAGVEGAKAGKALVPVEHAQEELGQVLHVDVGDGGLAAAGEEARLEQPAGHPVVEQGVQGRVLAPVTEHRGDTDDHPGQPLAVLAHQLLARPLAARIGDVGVGRGVLGDRHPERAGRLGAGEDEAFRPHLARQVEQVAGAVDVGADVFGVLLVGEIIVAGQVDHVVDRASQPAGKGEHAVAVAEVHLQPAQVGIRLDPGLLHGAPGNAVQPKASGRRLDDIAPDKTGRTGENQSGQSAVHAPSLAGPSRAACFRVRTIHP